MNIRYYNLPESPELAVIEMRKIALDEVQISRWLYGLVPKEKRVQEFIKSIDVLEPALKAGRFDEHFRLAVNEGALTVTAITPEAETFIILLNSRIECAETIFKTSYAVLYPLFYKLMVEKAV